ncbi:MAG TPA: hypothetical protein DCL76_04895 [Chloroflexi bacterium]|nr:hypothetical protein [Chloroflexota bacterium]|tara:strand:+ start:71 stop:535 length:465 start_codon:yes stop_codon:yes gene_type:complete
MIQRLVTSQVVNKPIDVVWRFFATPKNLNKITPPRMGFNFVSGVDKEMKEGLLIEYKVQILPLITTSWLTEITYLTPLESFVDEQRIGPYRFWYHEHRFQSLGTQTLISDTITYSLPFGIIGNSPIPSAFVRSQLQSIFSYRHEKVNTIFNDDN